MTLFQAGQRAHHTINELFRPPDLGSIPAFAVDLPAGVLCVCVCVFMYVCMSHTSGLVIDAPVATLSCQAPGVTGSA